MTEPLCQLADIAEMSCREFTLQQADGEEVPAFVLRLRGDEVAAYRNRCPHTGATLNWVADEFLSVEREFIQCAIHGALFRLHDGLCIYGPCTGQSLQQIPLTLRAGVISVKTE